MKSQCHKYDLNIEDKIYARTKVWGYTEVEGEFKSHRISYSDNYFNRNQPAQSDKSNVEEIKDSEIERLKKIIKEEYSVELREDEFKWNVSD